MKKQVLVRMKSSNAFMNLMQTKSLDAITLKKYLPISGWIFSTWHFLLNIYKNTGRIILKLKGCIKPMLFFILFGCNFVLKYTGDQQQKAEHHVCEHPVKSVASNALSL